MPPVCRRRHIAFICAVNVVVNAQRGQIIRRVETPNRQNPAYYPELENPAHPHHAHTTALLLYYPHPSRRFITMKLSCTVFDILSLIFQKIKLSSVGWDLLCSTHIKCTITSNEEMRDNAKGKNSRFEPPFAHPLRDLGVMHRVHLWLDGKRIVDFLLAMIDFFP